MLLYDKQSHQDIGDHGATWSRYRAHSYRDEHTPDTQRQAELLESLRYKWGSYEHALRLMQRLGDWWAGPDRPTLGR